VDVSYHYGSRGPVRQPHGGTQAALASFAWRAPTFKAKSQWCGSGIRGGHPTGPRPSIETGRLTQVTWVLKQTNRTTKYTYEIPHKNRLDKHWASQELIYDWEAE